MSFDLNITVNGNRCKQYHHQGKTFIEAKNGSEYVIEIKNNYWKRVLAVCSVDGLNVLTGKAASDKDSGYIVSGYSAEKIKGFRFSDDEWAMFKFGYKFYGNTYAQSKEDGSEKNCGVIGMKVFYENEPVYYSTPTVIWNFTPNWLAPAPAPPMPVTYTSTTTTTTTTQQYPTVTAVSASWAANSTSAAYAATSAYSCGPSYTSNVNYCASNVGTQDMALYDSTVKKGGPISPGGGYQSLFGGCAASASPPSANLLKEAIADAKAVRQTSLANAKSADKLSRKMQKLSGTKCSAGGASADLYDTDRNSLRDRFNRVRSTSNNAYTHDTSDGCLGFAPEYEREMPKQEFDMGTEWGRKERSLVKTVTFDRGCLAQSFDIYYASREALIAMGVPVTNELQVNLPQSFPTQYAEPPKNWCGC